MEELFKRFVALRGGSLSKLYLPNGDIDGDSLTIYDANKKKIYYSDHHNTIPSCSLTIPTLKIFNQNELKLHAPLMPGSYGMIWNTDSIHGPHGELFDLDYWTQVDTVYDLTLAMRTLPSVWPNFTNGMRYEVDWVFYHFHGSDGNWSMGCQTQNKDEFFSNMKQNEKSIYELDVVPGYVYPIDDRNVLQVLRILKGK